MTRRRVLGYAKATAKWIVFAGCAGFVGEIPWRIIDSQRNEETPNNTQSVRSDVRLQFSARAGNPASTFNLTARKVLEM